MAASEQIRRAVGQLQARGRGNRYPDELKAQIIAHTLERRRGGGQLTEIGSELDVPWRTLARWCVEVAKKVRSRRRSFRRVEVVGGPKTAMVVHGAHGVRVEGLDLDGLAELLRRLG